MGYFVALIQICLLITVFIMLPSLFIIRIVVAVRNKKSLVDILKISLLPFSLGYYLYLDEDEKVRVYNLLLLIFVIISFLGISFSLFQILVPRYDYFFS